MKSVQYLDRLMKAKSLPNDNQLAKLLGWPNGTIANYRKGRRIMDNEACLTLAKSLEIEPFEIIIAADLDRAERSGSPSMWMSFTGNLKKMHISFKLLLRKRNVLKSKNYKTA